MITVTVNGTQLGTDDIGAIGPQINRRLADDLRVCVKVQVREGSINMILSTPQCALAPGNTRPPTSEEQRIFDLWEKLGLDKQGFAGGQVVAFLQQLARVV